MAENAIDRINPVRVTDNNTGEVYELDFSREAVEFAERREFVLDDVQKFPVTKVPELFYYAFRMHHKSMSRSKTDALLKQMGGLTPKILERLALLYQQAQMANNLQDEEELEKNGAVTVEL